LAVLVLLVILVVAMTRGISQPNSGSQPGASDLAGTWVNRDNSNEVLVLENGGTFRLHEFGMDLSGTWHVDGSTLWMEAAPLTARVDVVGDELHDQDGKVWVRSTQGSNPEDSEESEDSGWSSVWSRSLIGGGGSLSLLQRADNEDIFRFSNSSPYAAYVSGFYYSSSSYIVASCQWLDNSEEIQFPLSVFANATTPSFVFEHWPAFTPSIRWMI
jgi:hypothetical protein